MKLIILMGKAGSGKDSLLKAVLKAYPNKFHNIVSCTTRPPREGEVDGVDYHFLSVEEFTKRLLNGDLIEAVEFNGWHYGTSKSTFSADKINIGIFNPEGVRCLMEHKSLDLEIFYIMATDKERLIRQIGRESDPNIEEIFRRFAADNHDFASIDEDIMYAEFINQDPEDITLFVNMFGQLY